MKKNYKKNISLKDPKITHQKSRSKWAFLIVNENGHVEYACYYYDSAYALMKEKFPTSHVERVAHDGYRSLVFSTERNGKEALSAKLHKNGYAYVQARNKSLTSNKEGHFYCVHIEGRQESKAYTYSK